MEERECAVLLDHPELYPTALEQIKANIQRTQTERFESVLDEEMMSGGEKKWKD